jgi:hypothetical protein
MHQLKPNPQPPANKLAAPSALKVSDPDSDQNRRYRVNVGIGCAPKDRISVQARRLEVTIFLGTNHGIKLDQPYTRWPTNRWINTVDEVWKEFSKRYGWEWEATEALLKLMCEDNVRNAARKQARIAGAGTPPAGPRQQDKKLGERKYTGHANGARKKTLLRRPNKKSLVLNGTVASGVTQTSMDFGTMSPPTTSYADIKN